MAGQLWATNSIGGFMYADELSDVLRTEVRSTVKFRQLADAKDFSEKGLNKGQIVTWNVYSKLAGTSTTLAEGTAMPSSNFTVRQGTATVYEWGIEVPFTSMLDMMSAHSVTAVVKDALARDCRETLDRAAATEFNRAQLRYVATGTGVGVLTTNGTATATNSAALNKTHVRDIVDTMKERNIPPMRGDDYVAIARPRTLRNLKDQLESVNQYVDQGYQKIMNGEVGRFEGVRFVEQTNINRGRGFNGTQWTSAQSDWCFFMGADTVAEVISVSPEIRGKIPTDYGRSLGVAWYALEGFGLVHTDATNSRIVAWDSAA